jgi:hypothetical protein
MADTSLLTKEPIKHWTQAEAAVFMVLSGIDIPRVDLAMHAIGAIGRWRVSWWLGYGDPLRTPRSSCERMLECRPAYVT